MQALRAAVLLVLALAPAAGRGSRLGGKQPRPSRKTNDARPGGRGATPREGMEAEVAGAFEGHRHRKAPPLMTGLGVPWGEG
jgi:hypothetical protein